LYVEDVLRSGSCCSCTESHDENDEFEDAGLGSEEVALDIMLGGVRVSIKKLPAGETISTQGTGRRRS
jgi:hypothetical protein